MKKTLFNLICITNIICFVLLSDNQASAQSLIPGMDAVITTFSMTSQPVAVAKRVGDPLGAGAPFAITSDWTTPAIVPAITAWTKDTMGQVFGIAIDPPGNVYFAATAMYFFPTIVNGNNNVGWPSPGRLTETNVNAVGASPFAFKSVGSDLGLIYRADAANLNTVNCIVTSSSTSSGSGVGTSKLYNTGFGIGNIAFSAKYNKLYATNLEDGKIYCINPATGIIDFVFDPLSPDNGASGIAPIGERLFAIGINNEYDGTTRVYYSVLVSNANPYQSVIRSVELTNNGNFLPATDVLEINLPPSALNISGYATYISDIAFSVRGEMLVAEKGEPHNAKVFQYFGRHNAWSAEMRIPISDFSDMNNSNGGVDYGFMKNGGKTICDSLIWATENALKSITIYGIQSTPYTGLLPFVNTAGFLQQVYGVDINTSGSSEDKGRFGDVEFFDDTCSTGPTDICALVSLYVVKDTGGCCYNVYTTNRYHDSFFTAINIQTGNLNIDNVTAGSTWGGITYQSSNSVRFGDTAHGWFMPKDTSAAGFHLARICLSGDGTDMLKVTWIGNKPQFDTVCEKNVPIDGCGVKVDTNCVAVIDRQAVCENGVVKLKFKIRNNSNFTMRSIRLYPTIPDVQPVSTFLPIADLPPGSTSPEYTIPLIVKNGASRGCFFFAACDLNVFPGTSGQYPKYCCMDSLLYCVTMPECDSCDAISITATKSDSSSKDCCYKLTLNNSLPGKQISCIRFNGVGGSQFALFSGWNIQAPVSSSKITICAPGTGVGNGTYASFANFCITGTSTSPHQVSVDLLDKDGKIICTKLLEFTDCELVKPYCANIVNDSLYCDDKDTKYSFFIKNNSTFPLYHIDLRLSDTSFKLDKYFIIPDTPIAPGGTAGPFLIDIDSPANGNKTFCMYLTGHNNVYEPDSIAATLCCTDSLGVICLPYINCDSACCVTCCEFLNLVIPSGVTPNNDGFNETFAIQNSDLCSAIKITVFNRWGNIVFKDDNYKNNWAGTNKNGEKLLQGTYFVIVELPNGSKKSMYIDIRY